MKKKTKWFDSSIIKEDHSKNTANTKHFILNNGTRKSILSPTPINYFDTQEKTWKSIDSSLPILAVYTLPVFCKELSIDFQVFSCVSK